MKILILISFLFLCSCSTKTNPNNINATLMSIKNYECDMNITFNSNKNIITCSAKQNYQYPNNYSLDFLNDNLSIYYSEKKLTLTNSSLDISKSYTPYKNLNTNPLFLSYFLNSYFNSSSNNILESNFNKVSIKLPNNNSYISYGTLTLKDNIPYSLTYYDNNNMPKINIIYNKFSFESS